MRRSTSPATSPFCGLILRTFPSTIAMPPALAGYFLANSPAISGDTTRPSPNFPMLLSQIARLWRPPPA